MAISIYDLVGKINIYYDYVYNYYSAVGTLVNQRIRIRDAYTCVEFVGDLLAMAGFKGFKVGDFHSLQVLEKHFEPYVTYEGSSRLYPGAQNWTGDEFRKKIPVSTGLAVSAFIVFYLIYAIINLSNTRVN